ncbi:30S ribosomal protein S10 [candidate division WWE3 bacterium CG08_land_8_20_14_0_20_43_13]|uniref:Small ribosomal subunit protein uS10 n=1 Tax=candidate division WWE3 bacterium CG08_land_8_20_14_0_20_43_13 TaxID=1975087 RepID=A0A2H0X782_UNCKA|nr:MAG: 30S ribosomal protein S10 [candidate division WWE3 bacterium CG08_land_8_20_14_0_20_43_13]
MSKGKIRIRLCAYDNRVLDDSTQKIIQTAIRTGAKVVGPIPLPTDIHRETVIRSPHIFKSGGEHFELKVHKRLVDIVEPTPQTIDSLSNLNLPAGVDISLKM